MWINGFRVGPGQTTIAIDGGTVVLDRSPNARGSYTEGTLVTLEARPTASNNKVDWLGVLGKDGKLAAVDMQGETVVTVNLFVGTTEPIPTPWTTPAPTPAPALTGNMESLDAQVTDMKFFESAPIPVPGAPRVYSQTFDQSSTRFIYWELSLTHPGPAEELAFEIIAVFYRGDGSIFREQTGGFTVEANVLASWHVTGTGFDEPGSWSLGSYRVNLTVDGVLVASETFQITG